MKKFAVVMAAMVAAVMVQAQGAAPAPGAAAAPPAPPKVKKELPPAQDLVLTGKVIQQEKVKKGKDGVEVKQTLVVLETADGIVNLPAMKKNGVDPAQFVGKDVTVTGKGTSVEKDGKKKVFLQKVEKIEAK